MSWRTDLPWLQRAPLDFYQQLKNISVQNALTHTNLAKLASYALDLNQLYALSQAIAKCEDLAPLKALRVGIISNGTTKLLSAGLSATGLRYGFRIECTEGNFDQSLQEAIDPQSTIHSASLDFVLVALDHRSFPGLSDEYVLNEDEAVEQCIAFISNIREGLMQQQVQIIFQTVPVPADNFFGNMEMQITGSRRRRIENFNQRLSKLAEKWGHLVLDVASLASLVGIDHWFDEAKWHMAKFAFSPDMIPLYTNACVRLLATSRGKCTGKCLVLDLDNTLWGGVIGDDGLAGIVLGQGSAQGEAHLSVQKVALALRQRGVILAVCSKNDEAMARLPFQKHPDMLLREEHIAVFIANWRDKATNLSAIAEALNIHVDSLVFLDDNPVERQQVREVLPSVAVPELPEEPALFARTLLAGGYFDSLSFTPNDRLRAEQYQENAMRALESAKHRNMDEYLQSLNMVMTLAPFDEIGRTRISQLIARSNQFNLTTRRYSEAQIAAFEAADDAFTLQIRLADRFGDNGMISVLICRKQPDFWEIDTWLMSCRVLNRKVEHAVLNYVVQEAKQQGVSRLLGYYLPTDRNSLVKDHYKNVGFTCIETTDELTCWELVLNNYIEHPVPILRQTETRETCPCI
ncbi:MAG: HAD-IIIC family phosphatase [Legionellaceae bacterium]|nr:HAD-IIIC family phosphatase [Legionellaceae bacterium]